MIAGAVQQDLHDFSFLLKQAVLLGATEAAVVCSEKILVAEKFARFCVEPGCSHRGMSASCPPAVGGPVMFRSWIKECREAVVVRLDIPAVILYSSQRLEVMAFLHEIVAGVEATARILGYSRSRAFAGGSCKELFCSSFANCRYLHEDGVCRNPDTARPSMSGFGVDVGHLMRLANWPEKQLGKPFKGKKGKQTMQWLAGLVLVGKKRSSNKRPLVSDQN